jgi:hypothetical protein
MVSVVIAGCGSQNNKVDVTQDLVAAQSKLDNGDIDGAYKSYVTAVTADPSNAEANFGAAMLGVLQVAVDGNTRSLAGKFNINLPTSMNTLFNVTTTAQATSIIKISSFTGLTTTPTVTPAEVQVYIKNTLIPALDTALNRLAQVESQPNFKYIVTSKMSKSSKDREIDLGEIYALDMLACFLKASLHETIAYNWDYSTSNPLAETNFGTLKSDGAANMSLARDAYIRMFTKWSDGINFIAAETDDQSDDCIPKFSKEADKNAFLHYIGLINNSLVNGATTIDINSGNLVVDFKDFYLSPVADWKVYINGARNDFPAGYDFTLNGLFPELTTRDGWNNFLTSARVI